MSRSWNRREILQSLSLGVIAGSELLAATAKAAVAAPLARCKVLNCRGEPVPVEEFHRFHTCDLQRPFTIDPKFEPGTAVFKPPEKPFRISLPLSVPGFGQVFVYADNRGRGYTAESFSADKPLMLNYEFAADRLATVRALAEECRRANITVSAAARDRADKAAGLLKKAEGLGQDGPEYIATLMASLCESLWAGEMMVIERADQMIQRNGPRPGFLFGCNAFAFARRGQKYAEQFQKVFNYATLPFYRGFVERTKGKPDYSRDEAILDWLGHTEIIPKGHPLIFLVPNATPAWLRDLPYEETKKYCLQNVREAILKFRNRIHVWDVINEAHVQPDNFPWENRPFMKGFTKEQNVDLTIAALKAAHEADPTCCRIVNSTGTWSDYYMGRAPVIPWQMSVYDYLEALQQEGADYEVVGLQYYHSSRDLLEFERNLEVFKRFGKPIQISELEISSTSDDPGKSEWFGGGLGGAKWVWHGERFTEEMQADWIEAVYKMFFSKPYVDAVTWWDFSDPAFFPGGGFLRPDLSPKPSYDRLVALQTKWRPEGLLHTFGPRTGGGS